MTTPGGSGFHRFTFRGPTPRPGRNQHAAMGVAQLHVILLRAVLIPKMAQGVQTPALLDKHGACPRAEFVLCNSLPRNDLRNLPQQDTSSGQQAQAPNGARWLRRVCRAVPDNHG